MRFRHRTTVTISSALQYEKAPRLRGFLVNVVVMWTLNEINPFISVD